MTKKRRMLFINGVDVYSEEFMSFLERELGRDIDYPPKDYMGIEVQYGVWNDEEDELNQTSVYEEELLPVIEKYKLLKKKE